MYVQLNIGRNVEDTLMSDEGWEQFIRDTATTLREVALTYGEGWPRIETHRGVGFYDGRLEESVHVSSLVSVRPDNEKKFMAELEESVDSLRKWWLQQTIAVIYGSTLIGGASE